MLIVFTGLDVTRNRYAINEVPEKLYMGFGYNPDLAVLGERLDNLNFFSWMKQIQRDFSTKWFIYDASGYFIVNRTPQKNITKLGNRPTAERILDVIVSEQDKPKRLGIMKNCKLRSRYLQRLIDVSGIDAIYIDSIIVFREDDNYKTTLDVSLEFVERLQKDSPDLVRRILPQNPNPANKLYLPLEIAEALYLKSIFNVSGKFGPKTEEFFDQVILRLTEEQEISYQSIRCPLGPRKPGYLTDINVIWAKSPDYFVKGILETDIEYRGFVRQFLEPFRRDGESVEECALRMKNQMQIEEVS